MTIQPRKGQAPPSLDRAEFHREFQKSFIDPSFTSVKNALDAVEEVAWRNYHEGGHKAPLTERAGDNFADPEYSLSIEWKATSERLRLAESIQKDPNTPSRILLICGSARNDGSCPGEISKTWRLLLIAQEEMLRAGMDVDVLDLSQLTSSYDKHIYPCKACVSTAMPLAV